MSSTETYQVGLGGLFELIGKQVGGDNPFIRLPLLISPEVPHSSSHTCSGLVEWRASFGGGRQELFLELGVFSRELCISVLSLSTYSRPADRLGALPVSQKVAASLPGPRHPSSRASGNWPSSTTS